MRWVLKSAVLLLMIWLLSGCAKTEDPGNRRGEANAQPASSVTPAVFTQTSTSDTNVATNPGFDLSKVPVVTPELGKFPYFGLLDGYRRRAEGSKDVDFDRYEFFDGTRMNAVEGRLTTIEADGQGASAYQVFKTYESLVTGLGGVKVFEGTAERMAAIDAKFIDMRHRQPVYDSDQFGVYVLRTPEREIWVEAYVKDHYGREGAYFLTVLEKKPLEVKASLLRADEMKKELDAKGHLALYINFDFDRADIKPESKPIIDQIVKLLKDNPGLSLTVEGHTDNVGTPAYNQRLSDARAHSVVAELTAKGIEARRLKAVGFGQDKPIAENSTDSGRAQNRRVELVKSSA